MEVRRFRLICDGNLRALIFIKDGFQDYPNLKSATIIPVERVGTWETQDLELIFGNSINWLFEIEQNDDFIVENLLTRAGIDPANECRNYEVMRY